MSRWKIFFVMSISWVPALAVKQTPTLAQVHCGPEGCAPVRQPFEEGDKHQPHFLESASAYGLRMVKTRREAHEAHRKTLEGAPR
jgi:hypothetical protein